MTRVKNSVKKKGRGRYREMTVHGFNLDSIAQVPLVLLKDGDEGITLPVWISAMEAVTVAAELINRDALAQSGTRDLLTLLLDQLQVSIDRIIIEGLSETLFDAYVLFSRDGDCIRVKVRSCEAVVMALKYSMPIMVAEEVFEQASILEAGDEHCFDDDAAGRFVDFLESLDPEDMGKYPI